MQSLDHNHQQGDLLLKLKFCIPFQIDLDAIWFSGHNLTASGVYMDKSEGVLKSYSLKLFLQSPSFDDLVLNGRYITDENQFKLEAKVSC